MSTLIRLLAAMSLMFALLVAAGTTSAAATVPSAPAQCAARTHWYTSNVKEADVAWQAPASDGGAAITSYTVRVKGKATPTVNGISPVLREYRWKTSFALNAVLMVRAVNSVGVSAWCEAPLANYQCVNDNTSTGKTACVYPPYAWPPASWTPNRAPVVSAGPDLSLTLPDTATLDGTVSDPDGNPVTTTWSKVSGSGTVTFTDPSAVDTAVTFSEAGTHVLRLQGNDGAAITTDDVTVTVAPAPLPSSPFLPYTTGSYYKSTGTGIPVDQTKTAEFHSFMASHPDQSDTAYPIIKGVGGNLWGTVYAEGKATDPIWKVRNIGGNNNANNAILQTTGFRAPTWFGSELTGTSDSPAAVMDTASGFTVFLTKAAVVGPNLIDVESAGVTWHMSNGLDYRNPLTDDTRNFTSRGRISDSMAIRKDLLDYAVANNTDLGHVLHLFIAESSTAAGFTHPMVGSESGKFGWGAEGERLVIRADIDLTTRGLSPAGLAIARTLQEHGMYIGDNAGGASSLKAEQESATRPVWGGILTADSLSGLTWADFVVLTRS